MVQSANYAAVRDVPTKPSKEECAAGMVHRSKDAVLKDVRMELRAEEFA